MGSVFGRWPWFGQLGAAVTACLVALLAFESLWDAPQRETLLARRTALESTLHDAERARQAARSLPALDAAIEDLEARLARSRDRLPARRDAAALLRRLEAAARGSGLTLRAFVPQAPVERTWYAEWPIRLEFTGTYQRLELFFERIRGFERIINLQDLTVRVLDPPHPDETIAAECTATTLVLHDGADDGEAADPPGMEPPR